MVDKNYCLSSYLAFRYIVDPNKEFKDGLKHIGYVDYYKGKHIPVKSAQDIANAYRKIIDSVSDRKLGLLLSGGMDSACVAAFLKPGTDAYTFRFLGGKFGKEELKRAEQYAKQYYLNLHYVDIDFDVVKRNLIPLMKRKGAPVHSIEPQIMEAALYAKLDGVEQLICADNSDMEFGGLDKMLSKDWEYEDWKDFYTFLDPNLVLKKPVELNFIFEKYRLPNNKVDYLKFMKEIFGAESSASYQNANDTAGMKYPILDPSEITKLAVPLNLSRIRKGESKYLIRELFQMRYPNTLVPEKIPMPRPVDYYFKEWCGPKRPEFRKDIDMSKLSGNQKWQLYCLEEFLNMIDKK